MTSGQSDAPQQFEHFFEGLRNNQTVFSIQLLVAAIFLGYMIQRYIAGIINKPKLNKRDIVYQEYFASGNSCKNFLTRLGGASRCLRLVVTKELLWVTSWFPFSIFAALYDLEHVIPLQKILSVEGKQSAMGQSLLLTYTDNQSRNHSLQLRPKNPEEFVEALRVGASSSPSSTVNWQVGPLKPMLSLGESLRRYWHHLIGVAVFPSILTLGGRWFHFPVWIIPPFFFAVMFYAMWPTITKRAPYTFWIVTCGVWMGGGILAGVVASIVIHLSRV